MREIVIVFRDSFGKVKPSPATRPWWQVVVGLHLWSLCYLEYELAVVDPGQDSVYALKFHYFASLTVSLLR